MAPKLPVPDRPRFDLWADVELDFASRAVATLEKRGDRVFNPLGSRPLRSRFDGWLDGEGPD